MTLRSHLYLAVIGALLPMAVVAAAATVLLVEDERQMTEREAHGRARAAMASVDVHLRASIAALETLAASPELESGDLRAFHAESQRVLRTQPAWVNIGLSSPDKQQLANAIYAFGKPEAVPPIDHASFDEALRSGRATIGSVAPGTAVRNPTPRVRVPVVVGEEVRYLLSAPLNLRHFTELLQAQELPADWAIALVDRDRQIVARLPAVAAGTPVSDALRTALARAPQGWFPGRTQEGRASYTAYVTSPLSGWVLAVAVPARAVETEPRRIYAMVGAGIALALALGLLVAWLAARRIPR